jgi:hypothetical protein
MSNIDLAAGMPGRNAFSAQEDSFSDCLTQAQNIPVRLYYSGAEKNVLHVDVDSIELRPQHGTAIDLDPGSDNLPSSWAFTAHNFPEVGKPESQAHNAIFKMSSFQQNAQHEPTFKFGAGSVDAEGNRPFITYNFSAADNKRVMIVTSGVLGKSVSVASQLIPLVELRKIRNQTPLQAVYQVPETSSASASSQVPVAPQPLKKTLTPPQVVAETVSNMKDKVVNLIRKM